jgi:hypothetical protein
MIKRHIIGRIRQLGQGRYDHLEHELETMSEKALQDLHRLLMDVEQRVSRASRLTQQNISAAIRRGLR